MDADVIVIGAGAAGQMCAAQAGRRGRRVLLIDHWKAIGERIRISGGGRCNFTNRLASPDRYLSENPHFCQSALARYTPRDFVAAIDRSRIPFEEREHGQLFCLRSARDVVAMLRADCDRAGVRWAAPCLVHAVTRLPPGSSSAARFEVSTSEGTVRAESVVVATGGLAAPQIGATSFGYDVARQFGLRVVEPKPALVPLLLADHDFAPLRGLVGVAFDSGTTVADDVRAPRFVARSLVTHQGLSGPAILQISSYWQRAHGPAGGSAAIDIDLLPGHDAESWLSQARSTRRALAALLAERLPRRLARMLCETRQWPRTTPELSNRLISEIARALHEWRITPAGTSGFSKAEVTLGGVDTRALSSTTMEVRTVPGLYFVGEVVDVTGWLGGYNFQWAWSSGWAAGQAA